jgi:hypothetical protein
VEAVRFAHQRLAEERIELAVAFQSIRPLR